MAALRSARVFAFSVFLFVCFTASLFFSRLSNTRHTPVIIHGSSEHIAASFSGHTSVPTVPCTKMLFYMPVLAIRLKSNTKRLEVFCDCHTVLAQRCDRTQWMGKMVQVLSGQEERCLSRKREGNLWTKMVGMPDESFTRIPAGIRNGISHNCSSCIYQIPLYLQSMALISLCPTS